LYPHRKVLGKHDKKLKGAKKFKANIPETGRKIDIIPEPAGQR
jgi:hypothetical protein